MAFKFIIVFALAAATNAGYISPQIYHAAAPLAYAAPAVAKVATPLLTAKAVSTDYDPHPQYSYAYDVEDSITGDYKSQHEIRDGDNVQGSYSFIEADGTRRIVDYTADSHNGFNAVVHKEPATTVALAAPAAKIATPALAYGASVPTLTKLATPIATYGAPPAIAAPAYAPLATTHAISPPLAYGAPPTFAKFATPVATPLLGSPLAKLATPIASSAPLLTKYAPHPYIAHVTYTTPLFSYSH